MIRALTATCDLLAGAVKIACALAILAMIAMAGWQVWGRFVLNDTPTWTTSVTLLTILYTVFLAAAVGLREDRHLSVTLLRDVLPPGAQGWLDRGVALALAGFGAAMIWGGWMLIDRTGGNPIPLLGISQGWTYAPLPISGGLTILFCLERLAGANPGPVIAPVSPSET